ncbi:hypothetical protein RC52_25445 [Herbaspirillum rubrisubalbicans]|nr:hypothetical protein [Herbaspirillum rubrisubalbicans]
MQTLDLQTVGQLEQLWTEKGWEFARPGESEAAFERFCRMLEHIPLPARELVIELTKTFSVYSLNNYINLMISAFGKIDALYLKDIEKLVVAPLLNPADDRSGKAKSGHVLPYLAMHGALNTVAELESKEILALASPKEISRYLDDRRTLVILIDDFVGSGATAKAAVWDVEDKLSKERHNLLVVALVGMRHALAFLSDHKIIAVCGEILTKGIAENDFIEDKQAAYAAIDGISADLDIAAEYYRGYLESEALVRLLRTPDNTFPMYWCTQKLDKSPWPAPFPR